MESHVKTGLPPDVIAAIVKARRERGWTQRELAAKVHLPQAHISAIETGKVAPRYDTVLELVRVLGLDLLVVPRALVPLVQSLIRDSERPADEDERPLYADDGDLG